MTEADPFAELRPLLVPGRRFRVKYPPPGISETIHIRGIVDGLYVVRRWGRHRQAWMYTVESIYYFYFPYREGALKPAGKS